MHQNLIGGSDMNESCGCLDFTNPKVVILKKSFVYFRKSGFRPDSHQNSQRNGITPKYRLDMDTKVSDNNILFDRIDEFGII